MAFTLCTFRLIKKLVKKDFNMGKNTIIHIGTELNILSDDVEKIENITEVKIQCCCIKVYVEKQNKILYYVSHLESCMVSTKLLYGNSLWKL